MQERNQDDEAKTAVRGKQEALVAVAHQTNLPCER